MNKDIDPFIDPTDGIGVVIKLLTIGTDTLGIGTETIIELGGVAE